MFLILDLIKYGIYGGTILKQIRIVWEDGENSIGLYSSKEITNEDISNAILQLQQLKESRKSE
jgi:hypothetical protein